MPSRESIADALDCKPPTSLDAQRLHLFFLETEEGEHDVVSCWCCCVSCDFNVPAVHALDALLGIDPGLALRL